MDHHQFIICLVILLGFTSPGLNGQDPYGLRPLTTGKLITPSGDTNVLWPAPGTEYGGGGMLGTLAGYGGNFPSGSYSATNGMYQGAYSGQYPGGGGAGMGTYPQASPYGANPYQSVGGRPLTSPYPYQSGGSYQPGVYQPGMAGQQQQPYYPNTGYNAVPGTY